MTRWNWKRWAFAIATGTALAGSLASLASDDMPKTGESITLKYPGQPDRVVTVVKSSRKPDGSLETEVKDGKSGETFTLIDPAPENKIPSVTPAKPVASVPAPLPVNPIPPLPKPVGTSVAAKPALPPAPLPPMPVVANKPTAPARPAPLTTFADVPASKAPVAAQTPMPPMAETKDKRLIGGGKLFNREPEGPVTVPAAPVEDKKPGILGRVFGKKPTPPVMPATSLPVPAPASAASTPSIRTNAEPPRAQSSKPVVPPSAPNRVDRVTPPTPIVPPVAAPSAPSSIPVPIPSKPVAPVVTPAPVESIPVPQPVKPVVVTPSKPVESIPVPQPVKPVVVTPNAPLESIPVPPPPAKPTLPPVAVPSLPAPVPMIPSVPMSSVPVQPAVEVRPASTAPVPVQPVANRPAAGETDAMMAALKDAPAPSARLRAVKQLSTGPHSTSEAVKTVLFQAAKTDVCAAVKADCIEALAKLDYRDVAFVAFVKSACSDESGEVRLAAKGALEKLGK